MMSAPALQVKFQQHAQGLVAHAQLVGDKSLNIVDEDIMRSATTALVALFAEPRLRCVVLSGPTEKAFIGGANLGALYALDASTAESFIRSIHELCQTLRAAPVPVIAVLRGFCLGAGMEIAAACDVRIGDRSVSCGMPEVRVGVPSVIDAALLPGLIGWGKARELMLRGNIIDADEAHACGFLQQLVDASQLDVLTETVCNDVLAAGVRALALQKRLFLDWQEQSMSEAIESGVQAFVEAYASDEPQLAIDNFYAARGKARP
jgi:enoyl-CoA hydratase